MPDVGFINFAVDGFYLQILFISLLFCYGLERRRHFYLRLIGSSAVCLVWFFFFPKLSVAGIFNLSFILIFIAITLILKLCFVIRIRRILVYNVAAASLQNLVAKAVTMLGLTGAQAFEERTASQLIVVCTLYIAVGIAFWAFYIRKTRAADLANMSNARLIILLTVSVAVVFVLAPLCDAFVTDTAGRVLCMILMIVVDLMVLFAEFGVFEKSSLQRENETIERMLEQQHKQRSAFEANVEALERKCHDMRHQVAALRASGAGSAEMQRYADDLEDTVRAYESNVDTGSRALDVILSEYCMTCAGRGIRFTFVADGRALSFMAAADVYGFFGNALENAVEALADEPDESKRLLDLLVAKKGAVVVAEIENACPVPPEFHHGMPRTTKGDGTVHGFGMKSIRYIVEKYGGDLFVSYDGGFFLLRAVFPADARAEK